MKISAIAFLLVLSTTNVLADNTKTFKGSYSQEASEEFVVEVAYGEAEFKAVTAGYVCPAEFTHTISKTRSGETRAVVQVKCSKRITFSDDIVVVGEIPAGQKLKRVYSVMSSLTEDELRCSTWSRIGVVGVKEKKYKQQLM
jgi:hypothetical protein